MAAGRVCFLNCAPTVRQALCQLLEEPGLSAPPLGEEHSAAVGARATQRLRTEPQIGEESAQEGSFPASNASLQESFLKGPENQYFPMCQPPRPPSVRQALSPETLTPLLPRMPSVLDRDRLPLCKPSLPPAPSAVPGPRGASPRPGQKAMTELSGGSLLTPPSLVPPPGPPSADSLLSLGRICLLAHLCNAFSRGATFPAHTRRPLW